MKKLENSISLTSRVVCIPKQVNKKTEKKSLKEKIDRKKAAGIDLILIRNARCMDEEERLNLSRVGDNLLRRLPC